ncbi:MAG TPA: nuclear transport factor 2 family protein [Egibacteraceae bacterium]|nr:nuclear transport factor 2 family protein [Egibacteraceae bacterium]
MERSSEVANVIVRFYEAFSVGTAEAFDSVVSRDPDAMALGTDRRLDDRKAWKATFLGLGGVAVERGEIQGFRDGSLGWIVDDPTYVAPDGRRLRMRLTAVTRQEDDGWKLVQLHISVAVPDEVALAEAAGWESAAPS